MTRPPLSNAQIAHRKKIQANISLTGGTLGLTALGLRGASAARGAGKVGRAVQRLSPITQNAAASEKLKDASTGVTVGAGGLSGVGAFNFASYTKAESRKKQPAAIVKGFDMMDFGLGGVQGEVSKAIPGANIAGKIGKVPSPLNVKPMAMPKPMGAPNLAAPKNFMNATSTSPMGKGTPGVKPAMPGVKPAMPSAGAMPGRHAAGAHRAPGGMLSRLSTTQKVGAAGGMGMVAGAGAMAMAQPKRQKFGKSYSEGMNISEHERRARDSRRTYNRGKSTTGVGGAAITGSAVLAGARGSDWGTEIHNASNLARHAAQYHVGPQRMSKPGRKLARRALASGLKANPAGTMALAGGAAMVGGAATMVGARANEKRHDHAVSQLRRQRAKKPVTKSADDLVFKAYDPERNRQRRMDHYQTGTAAAAGGLAAGAGTHTAFAVMHARKGRAAGQAAGKINLENGHTPAPNFTKGEAAATAASNMKAASNNATKAKLLNRSLSSYKQAAGHGGKAAALGAGAIGLGVASDRIRSYKRGRGRSFGQLRMTSN